MFAVIKTGGKQYRVSADEKIKVARVPGEPGDIVEFGEVLVLGGDNVQLGTPTVSGVTVAAEVVAQDRGPKIIAFKKRRRKNSRRKRGYREEFTLVRITEILTESPSARPPKPQAGKRKRPPSRRLQNRPPRNPRSQPPRSPLSRPPRPRARPNVKRSDESRPNRVMISSRNRIRR